MAITSKTQWLLLAASLPGRDSASARVRLWRALKEVGAVNLRDGVTVVPDSAAARKAFAGIASDIEAEGGAAWTFTLPAQQSSVEARLEKLFDRSEAYHALAPHVAALRKDLSSLDEAHARRRFRRLEADLRTIAALDFFPGATRDKLRRAFDKLRISIDRQFSPAEPSGSGGRISRRSARAFKGALWATRKRLWVDRVASAWLIKRFIDSRATFRWLDTPADCPKDAHGFDFDGAEFTHVDGLVTFEVLQRAFGFADDVGLIGLARLVHYLDVGGTAIPEAAGFEAVLAGLRDESADDDALLAAVSPILDALYQHFSTARSTDESPTGELS